MLKWFITYRHNILAAMVCLLLASILVFGRKLFWPDLRPAPAFVTPPPAAGMPKAPDSAVHLAVPLKTYSKKLAVKKMELPTEIVEDPAKQITATAALKPTPGGYTVAAVTDTTTGVTNIIAKERPRSLFGFGGESEIGLLAGVTSRGDTALVYGRQDLVRVGNVHVFGAGGAGVIGDTLGWGAFVGAAIKW